jgi:uncharacterized protein YkwD
LFFGFGYLIHQPPVEYRPPVTAVETVSQQSMVQLLNETRAKVGKAPLIELPELDQSAKKKYLEMYTNKYWGHVDSTGRHGYQYALDSYPMAVKASENLAQCLTSTKDQNTAWENSPLHYQAMIGDWDGVGFYMAKDYKGCWTTVSHFIKF